MLIYLLPMVMCHSGRVEKMQWRLYDLQNRVQNKLTDPWFP
jgi:hypothetical protein